MPIRANITSVEALEAFRANLIVYLSKARPTLEEVSDEVIRTRVWLESTQRVYWQNQARRRAQKLQEAQQTLFSAELSNLREVSVGERMAVHKARRSLDETEEKLKRIKKWDRDFGSQVEPLARQLEKLQTILSNNLPEAISFLGQAVKSLDAYSQDIRSGETAGPAAEGNSENKTATPEEP
jgi:DNA repair ATPase RecN